MNERTLFLPNEAATQAYARQWASTLSQLGNEQAQPRFQLGLQGSLGAGKSCFARALLEALGVRGAIPSPSYSLLEGYGRDQSQWLHMDWYRLGDELELEMLDWSGLRATAELILVEWPNRLPALAEDFDGHLCFAPEGEGRRVAARGQSPLANKILDKIHAQYEE